MLPFLFSFEVKRDNRATFFEVDRQSIGVTNFKFQHFHEFIFHRVILNMLRFKTHCALAFIFFFKVDHAQQILHLVSHHHTLLVKALKIWFFTKSSCWRVKLSERVSCGYFIRRFGPKLCPSDNNHRMALANASLNCNCGVL